MAGTVGRVALILKVHAPGQTATLCSPPEGVASFRWMQKLFALLQPLEGNVFGCCLLGSLPEVSSHLWQHQALWLRLQMQPVRESEESEHISVQFSELVDPLADSSRCRYANEVLLEDEQMLPRRKGTGGGLRVSIEMTALHLAAPEVLNGPELRELLHKQSGELQAFRLTLSWGEGCAALEQLVAESDSSEVQLRFDTVEKQLSVDRSGEDKSQVSHTLVMADDASELQEALSALQVCLQVPADAASREAQACGDLELPVDLSKLIACLPEGGSDEVVAEVQTDPLPAGQGITLLATLTPFCWSSSHGEDMLPGRPRDADVWASGARLLAVGLRLWRLSIEIRSIRLTARDAKVYVTYSYPPLRQPRAFRTNPPTPARKKVTLNLPHSFAAHTLTASFDELQVLLEEPLVAEVWHRDLYRKDGAVGTAEASLGHVLSQPLQYSATLPSMVEGFRVVDQACPILDEDGSQAGVLRLLVFLEDLGAAKAAKSEVAAPETGPVRRGNEVHQADTAKASGLGATEANNQKSVLESALGLELWRQTEEEKFRAYLAEQEADLKARLEEEYRQREEARAAEFTQRQAKIQHVEATVRRKLQELQQKELSITSEEARVGSLQLKAQRDTEMAVAQREDVAKQEMSELSHSLELSRARSQFLEEQVAGMEAQLSTASTKLRSLEEAKSERDAELRAMMAPSPELKEELQELRLRLREQEVRGEAIAASRDHFKNKVQELCGRLLGSGPSQNARTQETALTALGVLGSSSAGDVTNSITEALRKVRHELANLASHWDRAEPEQTREEPERRPMMGPLQTSQDSEKAERHLAWLRTQRRQLLDSGVYGSSDAVVLALDVKIAQAEAQIT